LLIGGTRADTLRGGGDHDFLMDGHLYYDEVSDIYTSSMTVSWTAAKGMWVMISIPWLKLIAFCYSRRPRYNQTNPQGKTNGDGHIKAPPNIFNAQ
jgi:hypothetical protein